MRFEWDAEKSAQNFKDRGFDFGAAAERPDTRRDYGEARVIAVGLVAQVALTVVYTDRRDRDGTTVRRIISARRSNRYERTRYKEAQPPDE